MRNEYSRTNTLTFSVASMLSPDIIFEIVNRASSIAFSSATVRNNLVMLGLITERTQADQQEHQKEPQHCQCLHCLRHARSVLSMPQCPLFVVQFLLVGL